MNSLTYLGIIHCLIYNCKTRLCTFRGPYICVIIFVYFANHYRYESRVGEDQEKCVDVAMAVEMVYTAATAPTMFDIAVMVGGDKDFLPAVEKTRKLGKKIVICSMKNNCNKELLRPNAHSKDFSAVWLDDAIDALFEPRNAQNDDTSDEYLLSRIIKVCSVCGINIH